MSGNQTIHIQLLTSPQPLSVILLLDSKIQKIFIWRMSPNNRNSGSDCIFIPNTTWRTTADRHFRSGHLAPLLLGEARSRTRRQGGFLLKTKKILGRKLMSAQGLMNLFNLPGQAPCNISCERMELEAGGNRMAVRRRSAHRLPAGPCLPEIQARLRRRWKHDSCDWRVPPS